MSDSVFRRAKPIPVIAVEISADDVMGILPGITADQAKSLIERHQDAVGQAMLIEGLSTLIQLLGGTDVH